MSKPQIFSILTALAIGAAALIAAEAREAWAVPMKVHFGNESRTVYKFQDDWVRCYYMRSGLDGNPTLSCLQSTR